MWMTPNERARGATLLDGGAPLGAALGAVVIAGLIAEFDSWRISFVVAGVGTVLCGIFAWWYIRNSPASIPRSMRRKRRIFKLRMLLKICPIPFRLDGESEPILPTGRSGACASDGCSSIRCSMGY